MEVIIIAWPHCETARIVKGTNPRLKVNINILHHRTVHNAMSETTETTWLTLSDGKSFSRLLYPNPVCFLGTLSHRNTNNDDDVNNNAIVIRQPSPAVQTKNVMVLSWLTAVNNEGSFVFAINRRRYTARILNLHNRHFTLSVPVRGMEELVLNVGAVSGQVVDKFRREEQEPKQREPQSLDSTTVDNDDFSSSSRRIKRKLLAENGVPGLHSEPFDQSFAIRDTVAQMACEITGTLRTSDTDNDDNDEEHVIYRARVVTARVDTNYWDGEKLLFRAMTAVTPPYLTFFGSQTFGYVYGP
jgi:flavin reductase (DIM6/NTAB) family NADH-FMN oxidoreductase RutF